MVWVPLWGSCGAFYGRSLRFVELRPVHHYNMGTPTYIVKLPESTVDPTILVIAKRPPTCQWKGYNCVAVCA